MERIPEPELMNDPEQAEAYAHADFSVPHQAFVDDFRARFPDLVPHRVLDLGCGSGDVTLRFARAYPGARIVGIDAAAAMLREARTAFGAEDVAPHIELREARLPSLPPDLGRFDTIISNSLLHHLADPQALWTCVRESAIAGARVWVRDLARPLSRTQAVALVDRYAAGEPQILQRDFFNSLLAAYEPDEIRAQLVRAGLAMLQVEEIGDRHVQVCGVLA